MGLLCYFRSHLSSYERWYGHYGTPCTYASISDAIALQYYMNMNATSVLYEFCRIVQQGKKVIKVTDNYIIKICNKGYNFAK